MKRSGTTILSLLLAAEIALVPAWSAAPAAAAAAQLPGTPYNADGTYNVNIPHIIVNQVYGGGDADTTGGYFSNGYIELYNPLDTEVDLSGWSLQYSDPAMNGAWSRLELSGTIKAHSSFLITDSKNNPTFQSDISAKGDQTWGGLLFNNKGMKVVLLSNTDLLTAANPFASKTTAYVDMIGTAGNDKGSAIDGYEGDYPTGKEEGTSKQKSVRRADFTDTDNNKGDLKQISFDNLDAAGMNLMKPHSSADGAWGIKAPALGVATTELPAAAAGSPYTVALSVYGGVQPYSFSAEGLPEGLKLDAAAGTISGTPLMAGTSTVSYTVYDSAATPAKVTGSLKLEVGKPAAEPKPDMISITKIGGYSVGTTNKDGGVAEIVRYNRDNGKFYLVNGSTQPATVDVVNLKDGAHPEKETSINVEALSETGGFVYGDLTSVDINTATKRIAVAVQEADAMKNGKVLVLDYDGKLLETFEAGVQPDMVKYTAEGRYILTADEAEPRTLAGDPEGSVTIIDTVTKAVNQVKFDNPTVIDDLVHIRGAVDPKTKLITGEGAKEDAVRDLEPEFIELSEDQKTAYVSLQENNAIAAIDIASGKLLSVKGLGVKDLKAPGNALDLLNDGKIQLENVPFFGVYMPDGISQYTVNGKTYLFTANEGDATEWDSKENASTIGKMKGSLHPESDAAKFLAGTTKYDGVEVMTDMGHDGLYLYGGRSFSIWDAADMKQVYDSGSDFEQITAERLPAYFNASNSNTTLDSRSSKKGPEPEYVKIGKVGKKALAFIGLERIGGLMTYDVTSPEQPEFVNYINTREFTPKNNLATDTGPEGIEFIAAADSPTGLPLVLVANEVGGTVAIYQLNVTKVTLDKTELSLQAGSAAAVLTAAVQPAGAGVEGLSWSSSNTAVASVDQSGRVTPLTAGTAVISVYSADGYGLAEAKVTVKAAEPVISQPGSSPSGGSTAVVTTPAAGVSTSDGKAILEIKAATDAAGNPSYPVSTAEVTAALEALKSSAADELVFRTAAGNTAGSATLNIPAAAWTEITGSTAQTVTFASGTGTISLDRAAVTAIQTAAAGEAVSLTIAAANLTTGSSLIGSRPVVSLEVKTGSRNVSSFGTGGAVVSVPYTLAAGEDAAAIVAYYVSPAGGLTVLPASSYNAATGQLTFQTSHFSVYAVGYNKPAFTDTASSYAQDSITYLAARGIISGISAEQFGLKSKLSRGDAALLLARLAGAELGNTSSGSFTDVQADDYFAAAVSWASVNGIVNGTGDGKFAPEANVSREQLAVMIVRLAEAMNWSLPVNGGAAASFADQASISSYAQEAAKAVQQAGILSGQAAAEGKVNFAPQAPATREETAQLLAKLLKAVQ
ncbi:choice-of-anchor I family protein [Paenibacillus typhae]|uniref:choice-of-anchor I family protein n=1 Tax=Paenibacillus typhae TaxID=1174501 RepID=UPI001C8E8126|nr:choice-of-anchor I family protein [Paenibacillus typhae]MBY0008914.1 choice-of-anchor I family protein [Paenibacillus typhae]